MKTFIELFVFFSFLATVAFSQSASINDLETNNLIHNVIVKSKKNKIAFLSEYQHNYKYIVELSDSKEVKSWVFEQYCLNDGKFFCQMVLIEKDGIAVSKSKVQKDRQKAARNLSKMESLMKTNDSFGYGTTLGNVWVDPTVYLRDCRISSSSKSILSERKTVVINVENCSIDREPAEWKPALSFMQMTKATIWIDVEDESIRQMYIYADTNSDEEAQNSKPLIKMENVRTEEGFWLFKMIRLETIGNENIFPNLKNNYQYDFFGYKRLSVDVDGLTPSAN